VLYVIASGKAGFDLAGGFASNGYGEHSPGGYSLATGFVTELVLTAGFDPLRDEGRQYAEAMRAAGVAVDYREFGSLIHGFANFFPVGGGSATATAESISALRAHLART